MIIKKIPHFYWTKKRIDLSEQIINSVDISNGIILDPFMGSGSSILGLDLNKYKFIGIDINEMPIKMIELFMNNFNIKDYELAKEQLFKIKSDLCHIYEFQCPKCQNKIYLEKYIFNRNNYENLEILEVSIKCNSCSYKYNDTQKDIAIKEALKDRILEYLNKKGNDLLLHKNSRIAIKENMYISDIFSPINFYILNKIKSDYNYSPLFEYILSSTLHLLRLTDKKSQSQFPYWIPSSNILDRNIFNQLEKKLQEIKKYLNHKYTVKISKDWNSFSNSKLLFLSGSAQKELDYIPNNSIDILFTDPPYYDQVAYSEYLMIWKYFLNYEINFDSEIIVSNRDFKSSNRDKYLNNIKIVFEKCFQKLKEEAKIFIYFKDSKEKNFSDFIKLLIDIGYIFIKQEHLNKNKITYKQNSTKKTTSRGDCLIHFEKNTKKLNDLQKINISKEDFFKHLKLEIEKYLDDNENSSTGELLDNIIYQKIILSNLFNEISEKEIFIFLDNNFKFKEGKWLINE